MIAGLGQLRVGLRRGPPEERFQKRRGCARRVADSTPCTSDRRSRCSVGRWSRDRAVDVGALRALMRLPVRRAPDWSRGADRSVSLTREAERAVVGAT